MIISLLLATVIAAPTPDVQYKQPQVAAGKQGTVITFGTGNAIYVAASSDNGRTFSAPVKVAEPGIISLGRHRGPRITLASNAVVVSAIAGQKGRGQDGDVLAWRSTDGGATWSASVRVNDVAGSAREGLHSMAASGQTVFAAWLDLRSKGTKIYGSISKDGGATWSTNALVYESPDGTVCECCHPSAAIDPQGNIYVMFRNSLAGSRDLYLVRSVDGGRSFASAAKLGSGTWPLNACPMDGGGLAFSSNGTPMTVWRRGKELFSASDSRAEEKLGIGKDPAVVVTPKGAYVAWAGENGVQIRTPGRAEPVILDQAGSYVQLATAPNGKVIAAWERQGVLVVKTIND